MTSTAPKLQFNLQRILNTQSEMGKAQLFQSPQLQKLLCALILYFETLQKLCCGLKSLKFAALSIFFGGGGQMAQFYTFKFILFYFDHIDQCWPSLATY